MESGEFNTCKAPWGFRLDGRKLKICEPEADIVQRIFREYLSGKNPQEIADDLNASCLTERVWNYKAVDYILAQKTAIDALRFDPKDSELNMYAILAMGFQGNLSMAQTYYTAAKPYLALEHAEVIKKYLNIK